MWGGYWLKYLSLNPQIKVGQLILVAPWIDLGYEHPTFFANWEIDPDLTDRCGQIDLFVSTDDMDTIIQSVDKIKSIFGDKIIYHYFKDKGHLAWGNIGRDFPEIIKAVK